jgi:CheY-like chemotaxis protein
LAVEHDVEQIVQPFTYARREASGAGCAAFFQRGETMNILVVDDRPTLARVTSVALGTLGCRTFTSLTIAEAVNTVTGQPIDALFVDMNLGSGESGLQLLDQLRAKGARQPVIIFTADDREGLGEEASQHGALGFLAKPFTMDDLRRQLAKIEKHLAGDAQDSA